MCVETKQSRCAPCPRVTGAVATKTRGHGAALFVGARVNPGLAPLPTLRNVGRWWASCGMPSGSACESGASGCLIGLGRGAADVEASSWLSCARSRPDRAWCSTFWSTGQPMRRWCCCCTAFPNCCTCGGRSCRPWRRRDIGRWRRASAAIPPARGRIPADVASYHFDRLVDDAMEHGRRLRSRRPPLPPRGS